MTRPAALLVIVSCAFGCRSSGEDVASATLAATVVTVQEVARATNMTIFATHNHSSGDYCYDVATNNKTWNHAGGCAGYTGHGGKWQMQWKAYCERQVVAACEESYPMLTGRQRTEVATWKGVNEHHSFWHGDWMYISCGRWYHSNGWEGANYGDCQSKGDVVTNSGTGQETAYASVGVGYAATHAEDQITITPAVFVSADGVGGAAGLDFSYRDQTWGNGYEVQCEYKCDWDAAKSEVVLKEKCWEVGLEDSDETQGMIKEAAGLTFDGQWRELRREACSEDDGDDGGDSTGDGDEDAGSDDGGPEHDAGSGDGGPGGQDAGNGPPDAGGQDGGQDAGGGHDAGGPGGSCDGGPGAICHSEPLPTARAR